MKEYKADKKLMGSDFQFILNAETDDEGKQLLNECIEEVKRIETLITEFSDDSETALVNKNAGICPVKVSDEMYKLIERSVQISRLTNGSFDITAGILKKLYNFKNIKFEMPSREKINESLDLTGHAKIKLLGNNKVFLEKRGMRIGYGAIGKGYAANQTMKLMKNKGVMGGVINASGDLCAWGTKWDGSSWKAGVANPDSSDDILLWLELNGLSIATSGNYEQYFDLNGVRYSHNIDPRTGRPVTDIKSVSVVSPHAELSDALATGITVMGIKNGLKMINQLPGTHCVIVDEMNRVHYSENIERVRYFKKLVR
jgi:thiamine biosynthesis lipoprotein